MNPGLCSWFFSQPYFQIQSSSYQSVRGGELAYLNNALMSRIHLRINVPSTSESQLSCAVSTRAACTLRFGRCFAG